MAATRLLAIHHLPNRTMKQCLKERIDYSLNPVKTQDGKYTSFYECNQETVVEEFMLSERQYEHITGRKQKRSVIAYMIRQSFKPGEITAEEANKVGYELAMRFTKGKHMFFVATHTDKKHIHNHILFNAITLDCKKKFRDFFLSGRALQKLSDLICIENSLSVISPRPYSDRANKKRTESGISKRSIIRNDIDQILEQNPNDFGELLQMLKNMGYEVKFGKHISVNKDSGRFIRLDSLGDGYTQDDLKDYFVTDDKKLRKKRKPQKNLSLLIDVQKKLEEGKGGGYTRWAKVFNVKQMAQTILFLQEHEFDSFEQLEMAANETISKFYQIKEELKNLEGQISDSKELKEQIINYSKTRDVYVAYRKAGYSKKFFNEHRDEIQIHKAAKAAFDKIGIDKIPKVKELNQQINELYLKKHELLEKYYQEKELMRKITIARENVRRILNSHPDKEKDLIAKEK